MSSVTAAATARKDTSGHAQKEQGSIWIEVIDHTDYLAPYLDDWQDLAQRCSVSNPFFEPWFLLPALNALHASDDLRFVFVYRQPDRTSDSPEMIGFFPVRRSAAKMFPGQCWNLLTNIYLYLSVPLVDGDYAPEVFKTVIDWAATQKISLVEFPRVHSEGDFNRGIMDAISKIDLPIHRSEETTRALLRRKSNLDDYFDLRGHYRRDMARRRRRLADQGRLEFRQLESTEDLPYWQTQFLELESAGWKGESGTAMLQNDLHANLFIKITNGAWERDQLQLMGLFLDDRPVAMKCNLISGIGAYAWRIAFDESYSKFSPGVLLELDNIEVFHNDQRLQWIDSCASCCHPMINRLWSDRLAMNTLLVSTSHGLGGLYCSLRPLAHFLRSTLRSWKQPIDRHVDVEESRTDYTMLSRKLPNVTSECSKKMTSEENTHLIDTQTPLKAIS